MCGGRTALYCTGTAQASASAQRGIAADEAQRALPGGFKLVDLVGVDEDRVPHPDLVPLGAEQHAAGAVRDDHAVLVPVLVVGGPARPGGRVK